MALVGRRGVPRIVLDRAVVEAEEIPADRFRLAERVVHAESPPAVERFLRREVHRVEPVLPPIVGDKDVREDAGDRLAARAVGTAVAEEEREEVAAADARVVRAEEDPLDARPQARVELIGERRLRAVVEQEDLRGRRDAGGDQAVEARHALIGRIPDDRRLAVARRAVERELERPHGVLQPEPLVEPGVVDDAIVVASVAGEEDVLPAARQVVGEADPRLPGGVERRTVVAVGEIAGAVHERRGRGRARTPASRSRCSACRTRSPSAGPG